MLYNPYEFLLSKILPKISHEIDFVEIIVLATLRKNVLSAIGFFSNLSGLKKGT